MCGRVCLLERSLIVFAFLNICRIAATAQSPPASSSTGNTNEASLAGQMSGLADQMLQLRGELNSLRDQLAGSRQECEDLRRELQAIRTQVDGIRKEPAPEQGAAQANLAQPPKEATVEDRIALLAEGQDVLNGKLDEQYQTKVESGSKNRVRLSGMALLNVFSTQGSVDNIDLPGIAQSRRNGDAGGSFGGTVRQSLISLEVFGPRLAGARTSGDLQFDFFGGFPGSPEGVTAGIVRMRTARLSFDWENTSVKAGQDAPFISPLSPTSLATTAYPALSSAGNLWTWTPEVHLEHRIHAGDDTLVLAYGILDPLTGEIPGEYVRTPTAGERSRIPAYAFRAAFERGTAERRMSLGAGAYYSRQNWGFERTVDAWAGTADWNLPLGRWFSFSGELYRGRSIGGLGGGASGSVLFVGPPSVSSSQVLALDSAGGWSQLKFKPKERIEFNGAFGEDYPFRSGLGPLLAAGAIEGSPARRNASGFLNLIYQPRTNLLLSLEYRRLWTSGFYYPIQKAGHINLGAGIIF